MDRREPGTFTEFLNGPHRDAGMGQIDHDFVAGQSVRHPARDHVQCADIFSCDNAVHFYPRRFPLGIDSDDDFQPRVPNVVVHWTVRAPWPQPEVPWFRDVRIRCPFVVSCRFVLKPTRPKAVSFFTVKRDRSCASSAVPSSGSSPNIFTGTAPNQASRVRRTQARDESPLSGGGPRCSSAVPGHSLFCMHRAPGTALLPDLVLASVRRPGH